MKRTTKALLTAFSLFALAAPALATPSTQIWIPSTDVQAYGVLHLGMDNYVRTAENDDGSYTAPIYVLGPTIGILPYEKLQAEVGFDLIYGGYPSDAYPIYGNLKLGTPENSLFEGSPALAVGGYNFGTKKDVTDQNITYALAAKNLGGLGRLSAGWYWLNGDTVPGDDDNGVLLSWDRAMTEISDKIWAAVDYQGGDNALGALNVGFSYAFAPNASVIFGYDIYNEKDFAGENTYTVQVDLNF
jgi:hypothetical protein